MDWEKYDDSNKLFNHLEKCHDLLLGYSCIKKDMNFAQTFDYLAAKISFEDKTFHHEVGNSLGSRYVDDKLSLLKNTGVFKDAFSIIAKMDQGDYEKSLVALKGLSEDPEARPAFYPQIPFSPALEKKARPGYTDVKEYPGTIEQFKGETVGFLTQQGIEIDLAGAAKEKSITKALASYFSANRDIVAGTCYVISRIIYPRNDDRSR